MMQVTNINISTNSNSSSVKLCLGNTDADPIPLKNVLSAPIDFRVNMNETRREMSVAEFAKEARVTRQAVTKMIATGRVQAAKVGARYIIAPEELTRYLASR